MKFFFTKNSLGKIRTGLSTLALGLLAVGTTQAKITNFTTQTVQCNTVVINWVSDGDDDTRHFNLEASNDGVEFATLVAVRRNLTNKYTQTVQQLDTRRYYRIVEVNVSTPVRVSEAKIVKMACNNGGGVADLPVVDVFPNPMSTSDDGVHVVIENEGSEVLDIKITDITGRIISKQIARLHSGHNQVFVDVNNAAKGSYIVITSLDGAAPKASRLLIQ